MKEWPKVSGTIDALRLANLLQDYDEVERELGLPDPLLSSYSCGNVTHDCDSKCCADVVSHFDLLYRADTLAEYDAHTDRLIYENRLRDEQQEILEAMAAEGLPGFLWVNVGKDPLESSSYGGRFVRLDLEEDQEQLPPAPRPLPAAKATDLGEDSRQIESPDVPLDKHFRLYSVRAEALDAIPLEARPEDVVGISEHLDRLEQLDTRTRVLFDWYEKAFSIAGAAFLLLPSALYYALNLGALIHISAGITFMFSLLSCVAVLVGYLLVRVEDHRVGPAGTRDKKIALWKRYRRLSPANAAAHHDAAQPSISDVRINQRCRRVWAPNGVGQDPAFTSTPAPKEILGKEQP